MHELADVVGAIRNGVPRRLALAEGAPWLRRLEVRREGAGPAFGRHATGGLRHGEAELYHHPGQVVGDVFIVDLVVARYAVGDTEKSNRAAGRRSEPAVAGVGAKNHGAVRGMEAHVFVTSPNHLVGDEPDVGHRVVGVHRVGDDLLAAVLQADVIPHPAVVTVGVVDVADVLLFPDSVGDSDDVVDDVPVVRLEAAHRLRRDMLRVALQEPVRPPPAIRFERDPEVDGHVLVAQRFEPEVGPVTLDRWFGYLERFVVGRSFEWIAVGHGHGRCSASC